MKRSITVAVAALTGFACLTAAGTLRSEAAQEKRAEAKAPEVTGKWTGTWGIYVPAPPPTAEKPARPMRQIPPMKLDCVVTALPEGKWQAVFEGEAGGPYKYQIKMLGRRAGGVVLFSGTADLGEKDGGVYDWIGRATDKEFVGFYTSQGYTGTFQLARPE